jgi:anti-anti-sigma regulatory factor
MTVRTIDSAGQVDAVQLADGRLVRISGCIDGQCVDELRTALLAPLSDGCRDVVVDAGAVNAISEDALTVLLIAPEWIDYQGGRFLLSASSVHVDAELHVRGLANALPRLRPLGPGPAADATVPAQRAVID